MRDGMITFSDLEGRLDLLRVDCDRCGRHGRYPVAKLLKDHGGDAKLGEWFSKVTKDCPQKNQPGVVRACDAVMPDLRGVWDLPPAHGLHGLRHHRRRRAVELAGGAAAGNHGGLAVEARMKEVVLVTLALDLQTGKVDPSAPFIVDVEDRESAARFRE